jgi:prepilin-type N-terminal cleavage/methylation domain-containing protein/prepilin-type processing-associated H-X9-DG protein
LSQPILPRRAFTLVELLAVVAIIVAILALVLPALSGMRQRASAANCLANIRSLQAASLAYSADSAGWLIDARLPHGGIDQGSGDSFVELLSTRRYCDVSRIRSPLDDSPHWAPENGGAGVPIPNSNGAFRRTSYGLNNHLAREFSPWAAVDPSKTTDRMSKVSDHANTVQLLLMTPVGEFAGADHPHVEGWGAAPAAPAIANGEVAISAVSRDGASVDAVSNWAFLDGHVETASFARVYLDESRNRLDPFVSPFFARFASANP